MTKRFVLSTVLGIVLGSIVGYLGLLVLSFWRLNQPITLLEMLLYPFAISVPASATAISIFCLCFFSREIAAWRANMRKRFGFRLTLAETDDV